MGNIVAGVDFSAVSGAVIDCAAQLAETTRSPLEVVHAIADRGLIVGPSGLVYRPPLTEARWIPRHLRRAGLDELVRLSESRCREPIEQLVIPGRAADVLVERASGRGLLVIGRLPAAEVGRTLRSVVALAPCPVVVVPLGWSRRSVVRILFAADSAPSVAVARIGLLLARTFGARLDLLHVRGTDASEEETDPGVSTEVHWIDLLGHLACEPGVGGIDVLPIAVRGTYAAIVDAIGERRHDLVLVGSGEDRLGYVASRVVLASECPVVLVGPRAAQVTSSATPRAA